MKKFSSKTTIISLYALFGILWITVSDEIVLKAVEDIDQLCRYQSYKGWFYIFITTLLLYFLISFSERKNKKIDSILTSLFQVIPDLLFVMEKDGTIIDYRAQTNGNLYVKPEVFLGKKMQEVLPDKVKEFFSKNLENTLTYQSLQIFEYDLEIEGVKKHFEARMAKLPTDKNIMVIIRDITAQVQNKQQLEFQSLLLEQSLSGIDVVNEKGVFSYVNQSYLKMWGYDSQEELLGTSPLSHCVDPAMPQKIIEKVEKEGEHTFSFKAKRKDGTTFDTLMAVKYVYFKGEKFYTASSMDVSETEKLKRKYEVMFMNSREGIFLHELDGTMIDVNPYIEKLHNLPKDKIIGINVGTFFKEEDFEKADTLMKELSEKGYVEFAIELKKIDGTPFFASIESHILELDGRQVVQGTLKDLTINIKNELLLNRSKKIFDNIQEGVLITNSGGYITEVNKAFETITGYSYSDALGDKVSLLRSGKHGDDFYKAMWSSLKSDLKWSGKVYNKKKNGEIYTSFLTISTIKNSAGEIENYIGIFTDISDVLEYEKELREKDIILIQQSKMAAMGEMIDNIAHQWKQPLGLISMSNGLIKMSQRANTSTPKNKMINEAIINIDSEVKHLTTTINDFRNFFSPNKKKEEFFIGICIDRMISLLESRLKNRNIKVIKKISSTKIYSIENELVQVLMNIINNAIDALDESIEDQRYIFIETFKKGDTLFISIKDNAGGIPDAIKDKVFESRFTTKEVGKGTGIGLYMSRQVIHSLGGTLLLENVAYQFKEKHYTGANFMITVPQS